MGCPEEAEGFYWQTLGKKGSSSTCGDQVQQKLGMGCDGESNLWSTEPPASQEHVDARFRHAAPGSGLRQPSWQ